MLLFMMAIGIGTLLTVFILSFVALVAKLLNKKNPFSPNLFWSK